MTWFRKKTLKEKIVEKITRKDDALPTLLKKGKSLLFSKNMNKPKGEEVSFLQQLRRNPFSLIWTHGKKMLLALGAFFLAKKLVQGVLRIPIIIIRRAFATPIAIIKKIFK